jgi:hypothetical protein
MRRWWIHVHLPSTGRRQLRYVWELALLDLWRRKARSEVEAIQWQPGPTIWKPRTNQWCPVQEQLILHIYMNICR